MSKIKVDEIRDASDSTTIPPSIPALQPQLAQAWVNFNGKNVVSINGQYNVSSITDNGVGDYTANLTTALTNTTFAASLLTGSTDMLTVSENPSARTTSALGIIVRHRLGHQIDPTSVNGIIFANP